MKRWLLLMVMLGLGALPAAAATDALQGFCTTGGKTVSTQGLTSVTTVQQSYPRCTVTVYLTGTITKATIYKDSINTPLANPFVANSDGSWLFFATNGTGYDVTMTGGTTPNVFPIPQTLTDLKVGGGGGGGGGGCSSGGIPTTNGIVSGDASSTNCGTNNRASDTATSPADVQTFGYTNLTANSGQFVVAVGNNNGVSNPAVDTILIGDTNGDTIPDTFPTPSDLIGIGNNNLASMAGGLSDLICMGDRNCQNIAWLDDSVAIGQVNFLHNQGTGISDDLSESVAIGIANVQYINTGDTVIGIGQANSRGRTSGGSTNVFEVVGIGDSAASNVGNSVADVVAIGDSAAKTLADNSSDVVAIGDGADKQCNAFSGCVSVPNPVTQTDVVAIGDTTGSFNAGSHVIAIGTQALGSNTVGAAAGFYNQGNFNLAIGDYALVANSTGANNTVLGGYAGCDGFVAPNTWANCNHTGSNNTWIGYDSGPHSTTQFSNTLALGYQATVTASNQAVLGNGAMTDTELFGTTHVNGAAGVAGGFQMKFGTDPGVTSGQVGILAPTSGTAYDVFMPGAQGTGALCNDGAGNLSWAACGGGGGSSLTANVLNTDVGTSNFIGVADSIGLIIHGGFPQKLATALGVPSGNWNINSIGGGSTPDWLSCSNVACSTAGLIYQNGAWPLTFPLGVTNLTKTVLQGGFNDVSAWGGSPSTAQLDYFRNQWLAWSILYGTPDTLKIAANNTTYCATTGTWTSAGAGLPSGTLTNTSGSGSLTCTYLNAHDAGVIFVKKVSDTATFTMTVNGTSIVDPSTSSTTIPTSAAYTGAWGGTSGLYALGTGNTLAGGMVTIVLTVTASSGGNAVTVVGPYALSPLADVTNSPPVLLGLASYQCNNGVAAGTCTTAAHTDAQINQARTQQISVASELRGLLNVGIFDPNAPPQGHNANLVADVGQVNVYTVTAGGSGFGTPVVTFSGGACTIQPTAVGANLPTVSGGALVTGDYVVTTPGQCTSAPTVTITGGSGAAANATFDFDFVHPNEYSAGLISNLGQNALNSAATIADKYTYQSSSSASPGGSDGDIQYKCLGAFCGSSTTLTPNSGHNDTISFGANYGVDAIDLYDGGTGSKYGWGLNAGEMQFYTYDPGGSHFSYTNGLGGLQASGTNEFGRLTATTSGGWALASGEGYGWSSGGGSSTWAANDTGLSRDSAGVVDVGNGTAGDKSGTLQAATGTFGTALTVAGNNVCQSTGTNCPYAPVSNPVTSATGGSGTGTVTCATAACTNLRGSYTVAGGTFATGTLLALVWPTTTTAYVCSASVLNNATGASIGYHSIATATGMNITSLTAATGLSVDIDYSCQP